MLLGATLLVAGFGVLADGAVLKSSIVQAVAGTVDMKERQCRKAPVAAGSYCPKGCAQRPTRSPEDRAAPPECHSRLWVATCGSDCDPEAGYVRTRDGGLADATRLSLVLEGEPDAGLLQAFVEAGVVLMPRFDGLYRYDAVLTNGASLEETKKRLAALPGVNAVEEITK